MRIVSRVDSRISRRLKTGRGLGLPRSLTKRKQGSANSRKNDGNHREEERLVVRPEHGVQPQADRDIRAEVADADADAADLPAVPLVADLRQHRVVELQAGLVGHVRDDEADRGDVEAGPAEQRREDDADERADDEERHAAPRAVGHRAEERRQHENDAHRDRGDDAVDGIGARPCRPRRGPTAKSTPTRRPSRRSCWRGRRAPSSRPRAWGSSVPRASRRQGRAARAVVMGGRLPRPLDTGLRELECWKREAGSWKRVAGSRKLEERWKREAGSAVPTADPRGSA